MDLEAAIRKADQVMDEELSAPTVRYTTARPASAQDSMAFLAHAISLMNLPTERSSRPRAVNEHPELFRFDSVNYTLLQALLSRLSEGLQPQFLRAIGKRFFRGVAARRNSHSTTYPNWRDFVSELPLITEFLTRNGGKEELFEALQTKDVVIVPGHILMLLQIEDMVALNYTVFNEADYERLASSVGSFQASVKDFVSKHVSKGPGKTLIYGSIAYRGLGEVSAQRIDHDGASICNGILEECRKAKYLYLKGSLLEGLNIEVNQDKTKVESYLKRFGFTPLLSGSLDEADRLYREEGTLFNLKSSVGHLRSFLENLHKEAMPRIHTKYGGNLPATWGGGLAYLSQNGILSRAEEQFAASFYTLISDEGVHPLIADREYARLARNMVVEYALLFLSKLEKLGFGP